MAGVFGTAVLLLRGLAMNRKVSSRIARVSVLGSMLMTLAVGAVAIAPAAMAADFGPVKPAMVNAKKAALGKRLFFDPRLSGDAAISCSTCHIPAK